MKFQGSGSLKRLYRNPVGVTAISLLVLFAIFTVARVDFEASRISPQNSLKWLFFSKADLNTFSEGDSSLPEPAKVTQNAWETKEGSNSHPGSEVPKNASLPGIQPNPAAEPVAVVQNTTVPVAESFAELVEVSEGLGDKHDERVASTLVEESDGLSDWDPGWGDENPANESELVDEEDLVEDSELAEESDTRPIEWQYDVCLLVKFGRRGGDRPTVPFSELYRLFNAAKGAPNGSEPWKTLSERRLFVGADFADILCLMVRDDLGPQVECTNYNRFGVKSNQCKHLVLGGTKKHGPQPSADELRRYNFVWNSMEIVDLDRDDPARQPPSLIMSEWRPTIVTGFSSNHVEVGLLLLRSLGKMALNQTEYSVSVVVWTMNEFPPMARKALACVAQELETLYNVPTEVRRFDFDAWPDWMRVNQKLGPNLGKGEYAWKAVMVHTVLLERGFVFWADAGDRFRTVSALTTTLTHLKRKGFVSRYSGGFVKDSTHVKQLEYFGANRREITNMPNCDASSVGFTLRRYAQLARPWYECSITRQCIAPDGSSRENHRQDQSALTILAALAGDNCEGVDFFMDRKMDSLLNSHSIGVNATQCYVDPLNLKWQ
ncbi:hypothetical protein M758_11G075400 [Ceratodon purpureus]|nr:hypothetical protein M758_11G075400 [Ceratodon purpureus]